ncbi:MAG: hypothetical protein QM667_04665 [Asticcacaulis sp.]
MTDYKSIRYQYVKSRDDGTLRYVSDFLEKHPPPREGDYRGLPEARFTPPPPESLASLLEDGNWKRMVEDHLMPFRRSGSDPDEEALSPSEAFDLPLRRHERRFPDPGGRFGLSTLRELLSTHVANEAGNYAYAQQLDHGLINQGRWKTGMISLAVVALNVGLAPLQLPDAAGWGAAFGSLLGGAGIWYVQDRLTQMRNVVDAKLRNNSKLEARKVRAQYDSCMAAFDCLIRDVRLISRDRKTEEWLAGRMTQWPEQLSRTVLLEEWFEDARDSLPELLLHSRRRIRTLCTGLTAHQAYVRTHLAFHAFTRRGTRYTALLLMLATATGVIGVKALPLLQAGASAAPSMGAVAALVALGGFALYAMAYQWHWMTTPPVKFDPDEGLKLLTPAPLPPPDGDGGLSGGLKREAIMQLMAATLPVQRMM